MPDTPLTADERDDLAAGEHYEREAYPPTCICGEEWICPKWIEAVIAADRPLTPVDDASADRGLGAPRERMTP